ncbi:hypothetical protein Rumeso_03866 [Rubellimicrobium mesophilum DSM 19309]|uniref:N-formylglutamate amidohydrolase n=1 Tax=Rubellimicrobium mesophilum DSM 19309 TaxID=442562 RepID=A0A017HJT7_9RHOB|nr:hypothetical protein Rumeso_03866 [Rubellimicrobium mesophilum DSM 19309]
MGGAMTPRPDSFVTHPAYEVADPDAPGPWVVTCDHASNAVPDWLGGDLGLPPEDMARHIAYDVGAAGLARGLARRLGSPAILARFSRLVIDPNRGRDDPDAGDAALRRLDHPGEPARGPGRGRGAGGAALSALS